MPPVFHERGDGLQANRLTNQVPGPQSFRFRETMRSGGGLIFLRRITPLKRRDAVYFCSGAYRLSSLPPQFLQRIRPPPFVPLRNLCNIQK